MPITLRQALDNYQRERQRIMGGAYPQVSCNCGFCAVVRAADLLYERASADAEGRGGAGE